MLHLPLVEFDQQFGNGLVELGQAEKGPIPQAGQANTSTTILQAESATLSG